LLDAITADQKITVFFNIKGREYNGRYFNNLQGWRIEAEKPAQPKVDNVEQESNPTTPIGLDDFEEPPF
jgi:single-strand DNA-binding protein